MSLLSGDGAYQDLLGQNASSIKLEVEELEVNDSLVLDYATPNKNLVVDADKKVITEDKDSFTNTDGNINIYKNNRNFDINLKSFSTNLNIVSDDNGELTTEPKDSFLDVSNQISWQALSNRQFRASLPQDIATTSNVEFNKITVPTTSTSNPQAGYFFDTTYNDGIYVDGGYLYIRQNGGAKYKISPTHIEPNNTQYSSLGKDDKRFLEIHGDSHFSTSTGTDADKGFFFGDTMTTNHGLVGIDENSDKMGIKIDGSIRFVYEPYVFKPNTNNDYRLGTIEKAFFETHNYLYYSRFDPNRNAGYFFRPTSGSYLKRVGFSSPHESRIDISVNDIIECNFTNNALQPYLQNGYNLGSSTRRFGQIHAVDYYTYHSTTNNIGYWFRTDKRTGMFAYNISYIGFKVNNSIALFIHPNFLRPITNGVYGLGNGNYRFGYGYINNLYSNTLDIDGNTINSTIAGYLTSINQNLGTTDNVSFATVQADIKTFVIESIASPNSYISLTSTNINYGIGGSQILQTTNNKLQPTNDNTFDLGSLTNAFKGIYCNTLDIGGNTINSTIAGYLTSINQNLGTTNNPTFTTVSATNRFIVGDGNEGNPALRNANNSGLYFDGDLMYISIAGNSKIRFTDSLIRPQDDLGISLGRNQQAFNNTYTNNLFVKSKNTNGVLYIDSNKEVQDVVLGEDEILVGRNGLPPVAQNKNSFYMLHQNQLCSKIDPLKTATSIQIRGDGNGVYRTGTGRARALCINGFKSPLDNDLNFDGKDYRRRFGFNIVKMTGSNVCVGFCLESTFTNNPTDAEETNSGSWAIRSDDGKVYEDGSLVSTVGSFTEGDIIEYEIFQQTSSPFITTYRIIKNGITVIYTSGTEIGSGTYYPQIFDGDSTDSTMQVNLAQTYKGGSLDVAEVQTNRLKLGILFYVDRNRFLASQTPQTITISSSNTYTTLPDMTSSFLGTVSGFTELTNNIYKYVGDYDAYFNITYILGLRPVDNLNPRLIATKLYKNTSQINNSTTHRQVKTDTGSTLTYSCSAVELLSKNDEIQVKVSNITDTTNLYLDSYKIQIMPLHL